MSDEAEKAWTEWVGNHQDVRATHRLAFDAGVESQQQRLAQHDATRHTIFEQLAECISKRDSLRDQLAARDAVIERVHLYAQSMTTTYSEDCNAPMRAVLAILDAAPESVLADLIREKQAEAWGERSRDTWPFASKPNPYRKGAGQ